MRLGGGDNGGGEVVMETGLKMEMVTDGGTDGGVGRRGLGYVRGTLKVTGTIDSELRAPCFRLNSDWRILGLVPRELEAAP